MHFLCEPTFTICNKYDASGRTSPLATYTYKECNGRLKKITYANGDYMTAAYNSLGQLVTEKWYNVSNTLTAHYKYAYDHSGNIVRSIDILAKKEYNYMYEDGRIVRAAQCTITMSGDNVTSKTLDFAVHYKYDKDGKLIFKYTSEDDLLNVGGTFYEYDKNDGTVVIRNDNGKIVISHSKTDSFGRKEFEELQLATGFVYRRFGYLEGETTDIHKDNNALKFTPTTNLVSEILLSDGHVLAYEYDAEERITKVTDTDTTVTPNTSTVTEYTYDALGQLLTETRDGVAINTMVYDNYGNITSKNGISYTYDATWKDLLTSYNGHTITYDAQGNPTSYLGHTLTWEKGRQLKSYDTNTYTYNANGIRTSKTVGGVKHTYLLDGAKILRETWGENELVTLWDNEDAICGIKYNGVSYYFLKNLQGDVVAITDANGEVVARYSYDAWGVPTVVSDTSIVGIATVNPFRSRGYYYDGETQLYYLQSRYYNPAIGRFVNIDDININISLSENTIYSLFTYCKNNPVNYSDPTGYSVVIAVLVIALIIIGVVGGFIKVAALHETESYKKTISGGKFLRTVIEFMLGFVQGIVTTFFFLIMGLSALCFALGLATVNAIKEFIKCKGQYPAAAFNTFINTLTSSLVSSIMGQIITFAFSSKNISEFIKGLMEAFT